MSDNIGRRVKIAEAALWIMADRYIAEGCYDRDDRTATDIVSACRHKAEVEIDQKSQPARKG